MADGQFTGSRGETDCLIGGCRARLEKHVGGRERRVSAQIHFGRRGKPAQVILGWTAGNHEGGFREIHLEGDLLHEGVVRKCIEHEYGRWISREGTGRERVHYVKWQGHDRIPEGCGRKPPAVVHSTHIPRRMSLYDRIRPVLFRLNAERAHQLGVAAARVSQRIFPFALRGFLDWDSRSLSINVLGQTFPNPVGLAAGFDKNGRTVRFWQLVGAGHVEIGSVSARRSKGNPRPRAFRLPEDEALVNRMGLNNQGAARVARRLARLPKARAPLGINLVKTNDPRIEGEQAIADFVESFRLLAPLAGYVTLNLSCPNTSEGKTFEDPNTLDDLLEAIFQARAEVASGVPILLKLSPPLSDRVVLDSAVDEIVTVGLAHGVAGFVATNTCPDREGLETDPDVLAAIGAGGLSGPPLENRSTRMVRYLYRRTAGLVPIIGVGGIASAEQAYRKIRAGASLVQLYTGFVYHGPGLVREIKIGLSDMLARDGFGRLADAVGVDA